ncbi:hypothetical protein Misp01_34340 [Microtetraspora sp. NBRC 13810]|uniref:acVLRF1 family peptidyl-tRNA hydrolase n=1 Tax=Microtetraspora sp. NBRC 13810 TaxID=3030990 RepID=UPI0024A51BED|nr:acVLRF1 family peptidyl-tRNA hydrolase [Microtetraspora sp. NBRC 13810]GLW08304.1 hypothetical protein Misp01_34340 [Microtetraspora sp. NBRC 13810]
MGGRPARGGGRWVSVAPDRLGGWIEGFGERHGPVTATVVTGAGDGMAGEAVVLTAADGAVAECHVPFPPLAPGGHGDPVRGLAGHAALPRRVGVVLVRLGGYAAGVFEGGSLVASKVGSRLVQGRTAAGGWSQRRFARRRENQAGQAQDAAAETALRVLGPRLAELDAVVFGGDRRSVDALRGDRRMAPVFALEAAPFLAVPDPRLAVLKETPRTFLAVRIRVVDPVEGTAG